MRISIIVAMATNGVIGREGRLPWHLSDDLRRFKRLTMGHTIVMGRRTWESIGRALPGRRTVVVSRQPRLCIDAEGVQVARSLQAALGIAEAAGDEEAFIVGGAELYRESLPRADRLYLTQVNGDVEGDTFFPQREIDLADWQLLESAAHGSDERNDYPFTFLTLQRHTQ